MYSPVSEKFFVDETMQLFPNEFTKEGLILLFKYIKRSEEQSGIEEEFNPRQVQIAYTESSYSRFIPIENRFEKRIREGKSLSSNIGASGRSLRELQQNVKKHIEKSGAICIGFTSNKTVVYTKE